MKVSVILPALNEALTIKDSIIDFHTHLPQAQIWVINNRSTDQTGQIARQTIANLGCAGGVIDEERPGKGNAMRRAFMEVNADVYLLADADMTYPAAQAQQLIAPIIAGAADMVVGDRHSAGNYAQENKRALHGFGNRFVRYLINRLFNAKLVDIMSGYRAMSGRFIKNYPILVQGFEIETDMTLHALDKRFRIMEIPVAYKDRPLGSVSKLSTLRDGMRVLGTIGNILRYYRPLFFFGSAAIVIGVLGLIAGAPVIEDWVRHRYIYHVPSAVLAAGLEIIAIVLLAVGLILDSIAHQDKRIFERDVLQQVQRQSDI
jgi:glycosyltransferase involved in cell wall biosynthesis